jgi:hypothetical protein
MRVYVSYTSSDACVVLLGAMYGNKIRCYPLNKAFSYSSCAVSTNALFYLCGSGAGRVQPFSLAKRVMILDTLTAETTISALNRATGSEIEIYVLSLNTLGIPHTVSDDRNTSYRPIHYSSKLVYCYFTMRNFISEHALR